MDNYRYSSEVWDEAFREFTMEGYRPMGRCSECGEVPAEVGFFSEIGDWVCMDCAISLELIDLDRIEGELLDKAALGIKWR